MKKYLFILVISSIFNNVFCQDIRMVIPTFYGSSINLNNEAKYLDLGKKSIQTILKNINYSNIEANFKEGDTISFEISYVIGETGKVVKDYTFVKSESNYLDSEFIKIINDFPIFTPAISLIKKTPVGYQFKTFAKFFFSKEMYLIRISPDAVKQKEIKRNFKILPLFGNCKKDNTLEEQSVCLSNGIADYIGRYLIFEEKGSLKTIRIYLKIDKNGIVELIDVDNPNNDIKEAFKKVIERMPKLEPALGLENEPIDFLFRLQINFSN
jgi:hypothetical protein